MQLHNRPQGALWTGRLKDASIEWDLCDGVVHRTVKEPLDAISGVDHRHVDGVANDHLRRPHQHHLTDLPKHNT